MSRRNRKDPNPQIGEALVIRGLFTGGYLPDWLMDRTEFRHGVKVCYARLVQYAGEEGLAYPSIVTLGKKLGVTPRQVSTYMDTLRKYNLIRPTKDHNLNVRTTVYEFLRHEWMPDPRFWRDAVNARKNGTLLPSHLQASGEKTCLPKQCSSREEMPSSHEQDFMPGMKSSASKEIRLKNLSEEREISEREIQEGDRGEPERLRRSGSGDIFSNPPREGEEKEIPRGVGKDATSEALCASSDAELAPEVRDEDPTLAARTDALTVAVELAKAKTAAAAAKRSERKLGQLRGKEQKAANLKGKTYGGGEAQALRDVEGAFLALVSARWPEIVFASFGARERAQAAELVKRFGSVALVVESLGYFVRQWDSVRTRMLRNKAATLPSFGLFVMLAPSVIPEAQQARSLLALKAEMDAWREENGVDLPPQDLRNRYWAAEKEMKDLGI